MTRGAWLGLAIAVLSSCAEVPPPPMVGTGGTGSGSGGGDGGGTGGSLGMCAAVGAGVCDVGNACSAHVWERTSCLEANDCPVPCFPFLGSETDAAVGYVQSDSSDEFDEWRLIAPAGQYDITLQWSSMARGLDLDLHGNGLQAVALPPSEPTLREEELAGVTLITGEPFAIEVEAVFTDGLSLRYNVFVSPAE